MIDVRADDRETVDDVVDSAVVIRCRFKVEPMAQWDATGVPEARQGGFDAHGIGIPFPHLTLHAGHARHSRA